VTQLTRKLETSARLIAWSLLEGGEAELLEEKVLEGVAPSLVELDGQIIPWYGAARMSMPGVRVTTGEAYVYLFLSRDRAQAVLLLERAEELAGEMVARLAAR
jgi:hypothetical protein